MPSKSILLVSKVRYTYIKWFIFSRFSDVSTKYENEEENWYVVYVTYKPFL